MKYEDEEILEGLLLESGEHLETIEPDLITLEKEGAKVSVELLNRIFRAMHNIKGGFGFFGLNNVKELSHAMENLLMKVRDGEMVVTQEFTDALLAGVDKLRRMFDDIENSEKESISDVIDPLKALFESGSAEKSKPDEKSSVKEVSQTEGQKTEKSISEENSNIEAKLLSETETGAEEKPLEALPDSKLQTLPEADKVECDPEKTERNVESGETIRVRVALLNRLMNLAGELVLGRNQIKQALSRKVSEAIAQDAKVKRFDAELHHSSNNILSVIGNGASQGSYSNSGTSSNESKNNENLTIFIEKEFERIRTAFRQALNINLIDIPGMAAVIQNVDIVTSELQSDIMNTRMQPIGSVFSKFPRIVRDMGKTLGKEIELTVEGKDVELDKSIIEALPDPLTHLVRNSADHGIESPEARKKAGKPLKGTIHLRAYHEGGQVNIDIKDDGFGIDAEKLKQKALEKGMLTQEEISQMNDREALNIIMKPGFSTAESVTDISGRGVGMDVVKTNIEKLGGTVEIESTVGKGTRLNLKLPLTLAIIPSLIVLMEERSFAIPQVSLEEMVRIRAQDVSKKIEKIQGKPVLRLREKLLPLVRLSEILGLSETYPDRKGVRLNDDRKVFIDRRQADLSDPKESRPDPVDPAEELGLTERSDDVRRVDPRNALNILILKVGPHRYGLIVEKLLNNEEIVVKPLSSYLKECKYYAGATIMGDGQVAMILDAVGIAEAADLHFGGELEKEGELQSAHFANKNMTEKQSLFLFRNSTPEHFALNLELVARVEKIRTTSIEKIGDKEFLKYIQKDKGGEDYSIRILRLHDFLPIKKTNEEPDEVFVIIPKLVKHPMGIVATDLEDIVEVDIRINSEDISGTGIIGSAVVEGNLTIILNIYSLFEAADPGLYTSESNSSRLQGLRVLLAEDTEFFQKVERNFLEEYGCHVDLAENGVQAWEMLAQNRYDVVITDIVMPGMNGIELTKRIRGSKKLLELPVIALTSLSSETDKEKIIRSGVNYFENKFDKESILNILNELLKQSRGSVSPHGV